MLSIVRVPKYTAIFSATWCMCLITTCSGFYGIQYAGNQPLHLLQGFTNQRHFFGRCPQKSQYSDSLFSNKRLNGVKNPFEVSIVAGDGVCDASSPIGFWHLTPAGSAADEWQRSQQSEILAAQTTNARDKLQAIPLCPGKFESTS
jgi:hypothetical protein